MRRFLTSARDRNDPWIVRASRSVETDRYLKDVALWELGGGFLAVDPGGDEPAGAIAIERTGTHGAWEIRATAIPDDLRRGLVVSSIVEAVVGGVHSRAQAEDLDRDGRVDTIYVPASSGSSIDLVIDPPSPLPREEGVRIDPYFQGGIAFESPSIGWRTYGGRLDLFLKRRARLVLRGNLGDYHAPQEWGMDALEVGDGPGIGGIFVRVGSAWIPCFGQERLVEQKVVADGPARAVVEAIVGVEGDRIRRRWSLETGSTVLVEEIEVLSGAGRDLASAMPAAGVWGRFAEQAAVWSFGPSAAGAGEVGIAVTIVGSDSAHIEQIRGMPCLVFAAARRGSVRLAWTAGGAMAGDTTASLWEAKAWSRLRPYAGR